jgi:hypothetical protein
VVDGEIPCLNAAVLAGEVVPNEDFAATELHARVWSFDHVYKANDGRSFKPDGRGVDQEIVLFQDFSFAVEYQDNCASDIADVERLVVRIEHEHRMMAIQAMMAVAVLVIYGAWVVHLIPGPSTRKRSHCAH